MNRTVLICLLLICAGQAETTDPSVAKLARNIIAALRSLNDSWYSVCQASARAESKGACKEQHGRELKAIETLGGISTP